MEVTSAIGGFVIGVSPIGGFNPWVGAPRYYPTPPDYSQADFLQALQAYLPRGRAWPRDPEATLTAVLNGLAAVPARVVASANALLQDAFPATTVNLLSEWQATLAQPDPLGPQPADTTQAQQFVVAKLASDPGQSVGAFVGLAAAYGVAASITEYAPLRAGESGAGQPCGTEDWWHACDLNLAAADAAYAALITVNAPAHVVMNVNLT